jgi:Flp pilus assembly protein TadG
LVVVGVTIEGGAVVMMDNKVEREMEDANSELELAVTLDAMEEDATEDEETAAGTRIAAITLAFAYTSLVASFK